MLQRVGIMLAWGEGGGRKALALAAVALTVVLLGVQLWTTDFGFAEHLVDGARIVTEVDRGGAAEHAGIAVGDTILEDPGQNTYVAPWTEREVYAWTYRLGRALREGRVPMRIRHRGEGSVETRVVIVPDPAPSLPAALRQLRQMGTQLPTVFGFLGVALLLAWRRTSARATTRPQPARSRDGEAADVVTVAAALLGPAFVLDWPMPAWPLWLYPVSSVVEVLGSATGGALLAYFAWSYPTRSRLVDRRFVRGAALVLGGVCASFSILNSMHVVDAPPALHGNTANMIFGGASGIAIFAGLVWQRRRARDLIARRQTTWLLAFCAAGIFGPLVVLIVPQYAFGWATPLLHVVGLSFPVLIPIGFAAVATRYRLFAVDGIALRAGPYAIALGTSVALAAAGSLVVEAGLARQAGSADAGRWLGTVAALLLIEPIRRGSRILIDRAFARDRDAFVGRCAALAAKLAGSADVGAIEADVRSTLDAKVARIFALDDVLDAPIAAATTTHLARTGTLRVVDLAHPAAVDALLARQIDRLVLVPTSEPSATRLEVLGLTLPNGGLRIDRVEEDALALVGRVVGATLSRAVAKQHLESEIVRAEEERRQIAMELHDGIGATLTAARSMTRRLRRPAPESGETLDALDAALRDGLQDLRSSLWGLDPLEASWDALVARIRRQAEDQCAAEGIVLTLHVDGEIDGSTSPAGRLAILRVIQEAVNNAVKHGAPEHVDIRVTAGADRIAVVVEDDGAGNDARGSRGSRAEQDLAEATPDANHEGRGLGNMARRIESLGGTFRFGRGARGGTCVSIALPRMAIARASGTIARAKVAGIDS